jgi:transcription antitermination factor NusG
MGWFVIVTAPGAEAKVVEALRLRKVAAYYPVETFWRRTRRFGKKARAKQPLIRGYVFAAFRGRLDVWHEVEGAKSLLAFGPQPVEVKTKLVATMRRLEKGGFFNRCGEEITLGAGDVVRLLKGPFSGRLAVITKLDPTRRKSVFLNMVGSAWAPLNVSPDFVEMKKDVDKPVVLPKVA